MRLEDQQTEYERVFAAYTTRRRIKGRLRQIEQTLYELLRRLPELEQSAQQDLRQLYALEQRPLPVLTPEARRRRNDRLLRRREAYIASWEAQLAVEREVETLLFEKDVLLRKLDNQQWIEQVVLDWLPYREQDRDAFSIFELRQLDYLRQSGRQAQEELDELLGLEQELSAIRGDLIDLQSRLLGLLQRWRDELKPDFTRRRAELYTSQARFSGLLETVIQRLRTPFQPEPTNALWDELLAGVQWSDLHFVPAATAEQLERLLRKTQALEDLLLPWLQWITLRQAERRLLLEAYEMQRRRILLHGLEEAPEDGDSPRGE